MGIIERDALYAYISTEDSVIMLQITNNYDFLTFNLLKLNMLPASSYKNVSIRWSSHHNKGATTSK